jgi:hypothetical protein
MLQQRLPHPLLGTIHFVHASPKNSRDSRPTSKACVRSGDTVVVGARGDDDLTGSAYGYALAPPFQDTPAVITGVLEGSTTQGGFTFGTLLATDIDGLADGAYFSVSTAPLYGQAIIKPATGLWTYLAEAIYVGADPFTVTVTDDLGGTTEQVIAITAIGIDTDSDTIYDYQDNCPLIPNTNQSDFDGDTLGDVCVTPTWTVMA